MTTSIGTFLWCELVTTDAVAAAKFYETAIGWTAKAAAPPNPTYVLLHVVERPVCGLMNLPAIARSNMARDRAGWAISESTMSMRRSPASRRLAA